MLILPVTKEKAAESGKEEPRLEARVQKINGLEIIFDGDRNSIID